MMKVLEASLNGVPAFVFPYDTPEQISKVDPLVVAGKSEVVMGLIAANQDMALDELKEGDDNFTLAKAQGAFQALGTLHKLLASISEATVRDATPSELLRFGKGADKVAVH